MIGIHHLRFSLASIDGTTLTISSRAAQKVPWVVFSGESRLRSGSRKVDYGDHENFLTTSTALSPPKANELDKAASMAITRALLGT